MQLPAKATPQFKPPAAFKNLVPQETIHELSGGVTSGFPIISYRGKVWRVRVAGVEHNYLDDQQQAMPSIEVVLVRSNTKPSKSFFDKAYEEGSTEMPRCFSTDGVVPDAQISEPISTQCASCPKNAWGSGRPTPSGKKSRACSDVRRMAVAFAHEIVEKGDKATMYLLRVPPASLNPLKDYAEKVLQPRGIYPFAVVTRIGFDPNTSHPKLTFKALRFVNNEEAEAIVALRDSEETRRILAEATEFAGAGTTEQAVEGSETQASAPAPASSSAKKRRPAARPAEVEESTLPEEEATEAEGGEEGGEIPTGDGLDIAPAPGADEEEAGDDIAPAPPPTAAKPAAVKPTTAKPKPAPAAAPKPAPAKPAPAAAPKPVRAAKPAAPAAAVPAAEEDFEKMLDTILAD